MSIDQCCHHVFDNQGSLRNLMILFRLSLDFRILHNLMYHLLYIIWVCNSLYFICLLRLNMNGINHIYLNIHFHISHNSKFHPTSMAGELLIDRMKGWSGMYFLYLCYLFVQTLHLINCNHYVYIRMGPIINIILMANKDRFYMIRLMSRCRFMCTTIKMNRKYFRY